MAKIRNAVVFAVVENTEERRAVAFTADGSEASITCKVMNMNIHNNEYLVVPYALSAYEPKGYWSETLYTVESPSTGTVIEIFKSYADAFKRAGTVYKIRKRYIKTWKRSY